MALVGALRRRDHRSVPEIYAILRDRGVTNLLVGDQDRIVLALDGLQPDVGHEVLWVLRDCLSGAVLLARSLLSGAA